MRILIISATFLLVFCYFTYTQNIFDDFEYYRVSTSYNGVAYNGKAIIIYGEGGIITRTLDGGNTWSQTNLDDKFNILSVTNLGTDFYGVINTKFLIKSSDNGANWQLFDFGDNAKFYKIEAYKNKIYVLSENRILILDNNLNNLKEYSINPDTNYFDFTISADKIVYSAGIGKLGVINLLDDTKKIIDFQKLGLCTNCPVPKNLFSDNDIFYFSYFNELYQWDGNSIKQVIKPIKTGPFTSNNGEIFHLYNTFDYIQAVDSLYFTKIDKQSKKGIHIKKSGNDRYIRNLVFKGINFISKDTIVAFGMNNLIYFSYNRGVNWHLKSILPEGSNIFRHDDKNSTLINHSGQFITTKNGGITWLPPKNHDLLLNDLRFRNLFNLGISYMIDNKIGFAYGFSIVNADTNFIYTNDGCETLQFKNVYDVTGYGVIWTLWTIYNKNELLFFNPGVFQGSWMYTLLFRLDKELNFIDRHLIDSARVVYLSKYEKDNLIIVTMNFREPYELPNRDWIFFKKSTSIMKSSDNGQNWETIVEFELPRHDYNHLFASLVRDDIFLSYNYITPDSIKYLNCFKFNLKSQILDTVMILRDRYTNQNNNFIGVGNKTYFYSYYYGADKIHFELWYNEDISKDARNWIEISPKVRYKPISIHNRYNYNDSLYYIIGYDSLYSKSVLWFAKSKFAISSAEEIETDNRLFLSNPQPNPAKDVVKIRIWWASNDDINNIKINVYNLLGQAITLTDKVEFIRYNDYTGEIILNVSNIANGVYIINVKIRDSNKTVPLVIFK